MQKKLLNHFSLKFICSQLFGAIEMRKSAQHKCMGINFEFLTVFS